MVIGIKRQVIDGLAVEHRQHALLAVHDATLSAGNDALVGPGNDPMTRRDHQKIRFVPVAGQQPPEQPEIPVDLLEPPPFLGGLHPGFGFDPGRRARFRSR